VMLKIWADRPCLQGAMVSWSPHLSRWLVLPQPLIDHLPQETFMVQVRDLHPQLGPDPVDPRELQRRPGMAVFGGGSGQGHLFDWQGL
jgi:hypothetical protein